MWCREMNSAKPKIGLIIMANEWFWKYKMFGSEFLEKIENDCRYICNGLAKFAKVHYSGLILNDQQSRVAIRKIKKNDVDLIVLCPIIWTSDIPLIEMLKETPRNLPMILWFYSPYKELPDKLSVSEFIRCTGAVGASQFSNVLKRQKRRFKVIVGSKEYENTFKEIYEYAIAAKVANDLKKARVGLLPAGYQDIANTWSDEFKITSYLGPRIIRISVYELYEAAKNLPDEEVNSFVNELKKRYKIEVSERSLRVVARASLGLAKIFDKYSLNAIAIQDLDDEMHKLLKTRPSLYVSSIFEKGRVVGMEGDIHTTIAMLILRKLTEQPVLFAETYTFDTVKNTILMGHIGMVDINIAKDPSSITVIPDCEYRGFDEVEGAYMYFVGKEGTITLLSLIDEVQGYRLVIARGESIPLKEAKVEGYSHILVRPTVSVEEFFKKAGEIGVGQHWAVTYGDHVSLLEKFAEIVGLNKTVIM